MQYFISFLEGITTFISPCLLPMLPVYLSYFAGGGEHTTRRTVTNALGFVLGFTVLFTAMGALAGTLGGFLWICCVIESSGAGLWLSDVLTPLFLCGHLLRGFLLSQLQRLLNQLQDELPLGYLSSSAGAFALQVLLDPLGQFFRNLEGQRLAAIVRHSHFTSIFFHLVVFHE